jgi:hypothetical protein
MGIAEMYQRNQASLISMAHVATPSAPSNRTEFDDDYEHRCADHENRSIEQGRQTKSDESF